MTSGLARPRPAAWGWYFVLGPTLLAFAIWRSAWWQWLRPTEGIGIEIVFWLCAVGGVLLGLVTAKSGWNRRAWLILASILIAVWPFTLFALLPPVFLILFIHSAIPYLLARRLARSDPAWRAPLAIALLPLLVAIIAATPPWDSHKWLWPWTSFRTPILRFQAESGAAADALHIPSGRELTTNELSAWAAVTPLRLRLRYPIVGTEVTISVVNPWTKQRLPPGLVWAWWGGPGRPTFGLFDVHRMRILSASD